MADRNVRSWASVKEQRPVAPERSRELREDLETEILAYRLAELRKELHRSQATVGAAMGLSQRRVSAIERGDVERAELSTIRSYVNALGGTLKVVADFGDRSVVLD